MSVEFLAARLAEFADLPALTGIDGTTTYGALCRKIGTWRDWLETQRVGRGTCVAYRGGFDAEAVALFLALALNRQIVAPCVPGPTEDTGPADVPETFAAAALADVVIRPDMKGGPICDRRAPEGHALMEWLRARGEAGLILFSSGSTGVPKAVLLSLDRLLSRHRQRRPGNTTLAFLDSSHIGGVNTALHTLCHGGLLVVPEERTPAAVCSAIQRHGVAVLPTTPTFLNLLLMSGEIGRNDLSALRVVSYGTECMPQATLSALAQALPGVRLKQTYGSTETGILPTRSRDGASRWMDVGGAGVELQVREGRLFARAAEQMLGYLNAPQPFDADGWYDTGDLVEEKDGMIRIAGRVSEVINVGGHKVMPGEVENCLMQAENVLDAVVEGRRNPVTGQAVVARVVLRSGEDAEAAEDRLLSFCRARLEPYKLPVVFQFTAEPLYSARFKRQRLSTS